MDLLRIGLVLARDVGTSRLPWPTLRRFIENLDENSAVARARRRYGPDVSTMLQREQLYWAQMQFWAQTKEAASGRNRPERVKLPGETQAQAGRSRPSASYDKKLAAQQARRQAELARMQP